MELFVTLEDYPDVPAAVLPLTIQYREKRPPEIIEDNRNTTESGFEVFPFEPDMKLDNVTVSGYNTIQYHLPELKNSLDQVSPMYIDLPDEVKEFATYDPINHIIHVERTLLKAEHEGTYEIEVEIGYGSSTME